MPGIWELRPNVLVAILTREVVSTAWAKSYRDMVLPPNSASSFIVGMPFDHARNTACEAMLNNNFQWLFFLDDDVLVPPNTLQTLISNNLDVVSGLYYRRALPITPVALVEPGPTPIDKFVAGSILPVDYVGAGCLLIKREVLEKTPRPWFEWTLDKNLPGRKLSEDFEFCRRARAAGFQVHVDTRVQCQHVGLGMSAIGGTYQPVSL